ncbi:MAG: Bug family tripartite tricarboxylate transporter substrate binding protein [Burkholderiaceae bacterium]
MTSLKCLTGIFTMAFAALLPLPSAMARDAAYPTRPVTIIVPFATGGGTDLLARFWGAILQKELGQPFVADVKPGASGSIGTRLAAKAEPDGYTLLIATPSIVMNPFIIDNVGYDPIKDFQPIAVTGVSPLAFVVPLGSPINSINDLIKQARAEPGKLNVGTYGNGSVGQMASLKFQALTGTKLTEIPYKGAAPALLDLVAGRTDLQIEAFPSVIGYIKNGKVKPLAIGSRKRSPLLPDMPTVLESGIDFETFSWTAFLAPAKTPRPIIDKLHAAFRKALADPETVAKLADAFGSDPGDGTPEDARKFMIERYQENAKLVKQFNLK